MSSTPLRSTGKVPFSLVNIQEPCTFIEVPQSDGGFAIGVAGGSSAIEIDPAGKLYIVDGSIGGMTGPTGPTGAQGVTGPTGAQGVKGATGAQGVTGPTGSALPGSPIGVTGATGGNVALKNLLTALATLGLITDSTT